MNKTTLPTTIPFNPIMINPILISRVTLHIIRIFACFVIPLLILFSLYNFVFLNQPSNLSLDLAKQNAASNTNGTVGRIGNITPIIPNPNDIHPIRIYRIFFIIPPQLDSSNSFLTKEVTSC